MLSEERDRTLPMSSLAAGSFESISRLSHTVARLQKRGWVNKQAGSGSRRHNTVSLTDEGFEALVEAAPQHVAEVRRLVTDPLTPAEIRTSAKISRKLIGAVSADAIVLLDEMIPLVIERNNAR